MFYSVLHNIVPKYPKSYLKHEKRPFSRGKKEEMRSDIILTFFFIFELKEWLESKDVIRKLQYMTGSSMMNLHIKKLKLKTLVGLSLPFCHSDSKKCRTIIPW